MGRSTENAARVSVGVFGKHPGWDDHMDDLGLDTQRLVSIRRELYAEGVSGNVDSGAWDKLDESSRFEGYEHTFMWFSGDDVCVGRMWSSTDAKGRSQYPMVIVAEGPGLDPAWLTRAFLPRLEWARGALAESPDAAGVRAIAERLSEEARGLAASAGDQAFGERDPDPFLLAAIADRSELAADGQRAMGLVRVMYEIEKEMDEFKRPDSKSWRRSRMISGRPRHVRVPAWGDAGSCLLAWRAFMRTQLSPSAPLIALAPVKPGGRCVGWADLIVGEPSVAQFFAVRAGVRALPLTSEIPYTMELAFAEQCRAKFEQWKRGDLGVEISASSGSSTLAKLAGAASGGGVSGGGAAAASAGDEDARGMDPTLVLGITLVIAALVIAALAMLGCSSTGGEP